MAFPGAALKAEFTIKGHNPFTIASTEAEFAHDRASFPVLGANRCVFIIIFHHVTTSLVF